MILREIQSMLMVAEFYTTIGSTIGLYALNPEPLNAFFSKGFNNITLSFCTSIPGGDLNNYF